MVNVGQLALGAFGGGALLGGASLRDVSFNGSGASLNSGALQPNNSSLSNAMANLTSQDPNANVNVNMNMNANANPFITSSNGYFLSHGHLPNQPESQLGFPFARSLDCNTLGKLYILLYPDYDSRAFRIIFYQRLRCECFYWQ